jgi:DNA polymerase IIIc chi subunit
VNGCLFHDARQGQRERILFEIVESAYKRQEKVLVYASTEMRANEIDRTLWIHKQEAFIPHKICRPNEPEPTVPVAIVTEEINPLKAGILVADGHCSIEFACDFSSIHEFVDRSSPEIQQACRERYRTYRERALPVEYLKD